MKIAPLVYNTTGRKEPIILHFSESKGYVFKESFGNGIYNDMFDLLSPLNNESIDFTIER